MAVPGWEIVIGLEIHAELKTRSKAFCGCSTEFGAKPNTHVCPVCLGLPGALPVLNQQAVEYAVKTGLALHCEIARFCKWDRKNYFYPDLPKAYQISQYDLPICHHGYLEVEVDGEVQRVGITRVHLEEDAGRSVHLGSSIVESPITLLDYNRSGVPLVEIVTEPDLRSPEQARRFVEELRRILSFIGVSDVKMEEGSLRCDANISVRPTGRQQLGTKTEIKNIGSLRAIERALTYEASRQVAVLAAGGRVVQETRHWDDEAGVSRGMRSKEEANDYRYFPDPDLVPLVLAPEQIDRWRAALPELPGVRQRRFMTQYGLPAYDAAILTSSPAVADLFEQTAAQVGDAKAVSNWVMGEVLRLMRTEGRELPETGLRAEGLAQLLAMVKEGQISAASGKEVLEEMFHSGESPQAIVERRGLSQISDQDSLRRLVQGVIAANPDAVASIRAGKGKAMGALVGQVMRETKGKANPKVVNDLLRQLLERTV